MPKPKDGQDGTTVTATIDAEDRIAEMIDRFIRDGATVDGAKRLAAERLQAAREVLSA